MEQAKWLNIVGAIKAPDYAKYSYFITSEGEVLRIPLKELHKLEWAKSTVLCKIDVLPERNYSILANGSIIEVVFGKNFNHTHIGTNPWKKILKRI